MQQQQQEQARRRQEELRKQELAKSQPQAVAIQREEGSANE